WAGFELEVGLKKGEKGGHVGESEEILREVKGGRGEGESKPEPKNSPSRVQATAPSAPPEPSTFQDPFNRHVEEKAATTAVHLQKAERIERVGDIVQIVLTNA